MDKLLKRTLNEKIRTQRYSSRSDYVIMAERPLSNPNTKIYIGAGWIRIEIKIKL